MGFPSQERDHRKIPKKKKKILDNIIQSLKRNELCNKGLYFFFSFNICREIMISFSLPQDFSPKNHKRVRTWVTYSAQIPKKNSKLKNFDG